MNSEHSLSLLAAATLIGSLSAQSLDLPGPDGFVAVPHSSALVPQSGITVEAWVVLNSLSGRPTIARKNPTAFNESYNLRVEFGRPQWQVFGVNGNQLLWPTIQIPTGVPTHIAATYDNATSRLYVDGVMVAEAVTTAGPLLDTGGELRIGKGDDVSGGETFFGDIDAVRIWNQARLPHQIADGLGHELTTAPGLVASWNFDDDYTDETGNHDGSPSGTAGFTPEFTPFAQAIETTQPGGGFVEVANAPDLVPKNGLTIEAWLTWNGSGSRPTIMRKDPVPLAESYNFRVEFGSPQIILRTVNGLQTLWATGTQVPPNTPVHLAATYNGTDIRLYMDGVLIDSMSGQFGPLQPSTGPLRLGKGDDLGGEEWRGKIDSVRLWGVGLTGAEVARLRNRELAGLPGLVASWHMNGDLTDSTGNHDGVAVGGTINFVDQIGGQTGATDIGLIPYGTPSSNCVTKPRIWASSPAETGNGSFSFGSYGGPPSSLWLHALALGGLAAPVSAIGVDIWVNPLAGYATAAGIGDSLGTSRTTLGIPNNPALAGAQLFGQALWFDPCGAQGITASDGLQITIRY